MIQEAKSPEKPDTPQEAPSLDSPQEDQADLVEEAAEAPAEATPVEEAAEESTEQDAPLAEDPKGQEPKEAPDDKTAELCSKLTKALLKAHSVPAELEKLLPSDPFDLEEYLESEDYQKLKAKLDKPVLPPPAASEPAPKPEPKSPADTQHDRLSRIGLALVGG